MAKSRGAKALWHSIFSHKLRISLWACTGMAQMQYTPDDGRVLFARELLA
jgi:hypothetical protein